MNNWPYRPLSDFLTEREGRFKPNDAEIAAYKRLDKIDFSGQIHISEKPSKTDMIIIEPGDLVISGINVAKGALAVYEGNEPVTATIHYSSYTYNKNQIDIAFLKRFLKSPAFISELQDQVKGGIKTEIKPKHLLTLKARIPALAEQQKINHHFDAIENEIEELSNEVNTQSIYLKKIRQAILQEAIEGKLTADWRKENPVRKGDPDYDAEALLEKIQAEKEKLIKEGKIKKQKPLAPINPEEVPFELPEGWLWSRLGEIGLFGRGKSKHRPRNDPSLFKDGKYPFIQTGEVAQSKKSAFKILQAERFYNAKGLAQSNLWKSGTLCITIAANIAETGFLTFDACFPDSVVGFTSLSGTSTPWYIRYFLSCAQSDLLRFAPATAQKNINLEIIGDLVVPTPPLAEQQTIVVRVEKLLSMVDELEKQVSERKEQSEQLMQAVLREAFEGGR